MAAGPRQDGTLSRPDATQRVDRWLWFARVVKSRTLAAGLVEDGKVRLNRQKLGKASQAVRIGDVLTVTVGPRVRILEIVALGHRRGPPAEAQTLFNDLSPPPPPREEFGLAAPQAARPQGDGRPTKRDRRATDRLKDPFGEED
jgi:ribosome-associated heat shock protein Hsp15